MYCLADTSIVVNRPISVVFDYVSDLTHFGDWFPAVHTVKSGNNKAIDQPGKVYWETVATGLGRVQHIEIKVVDAEPNRRLVTEGQLPSLLPRMEITFRRDDNLKATRIRWCMYSRRSHGLGRYLLLPIARKIMSQRAPIGLQNLKRILEKTND